MRGADGVRVLEVGTRISSAFAGLILSAQGAEVCQVREGLRRTLDTVQAAYFDRGRIDLALGPNLLDLARAADLLLTDLPPAELRRLGLPACSDALTALRPGLAHVAITSLGLDGPHAELAMDDITDWAAGGLAYVTRRAVPDDDTSGYRPVLVPGRQPEMLAGLAAAIAAFAAVRMARATGEAVLADVSRQEVQAAMLHGVVPPFVWNASVLGSPSARLSAIGMLLPAADGQIYLRTVEEHQWRSLVSWMGDPEWAQEAWVSDPMQRRASWDVIRSLVGEWTAQHPRRWLYEEGQRHRVPVALPREPEEVLDAEQLAVRGIWRDVPVGEAPARAPAVPLVDDGDLPAVRTESATSVLARWTR